MAEYILEINTALVNEETGEAVMHPEFRGKLIRCKDCKWFAPCADGYGDCMYQYESNGFVYGNDFCSKAERKEECPN